MDATELNLWFDQKRQDQIVEQLGKRVGLTRVRAECFVRLWIYLLVKQQRAQRPNLKPPLTELICPDGTVICTHREAAELFYHDKERGSDRAAGMMLDKLVALGLIKRYFDGNTTHIAIQPISELTNPPADELVKLQLDDFDPRCDAIPVANLLAVNYNWMSRNTDAFPHRIASLLRQWAKQYGVGMRVLRRCDNFNPVGFYLLYPTTSNSDANFFIAPSKGLHLSTMSEVDPFKLATSGDPDCVSVFIRSWMIAPVYVERYRIAFLKDIQQTLIRMQQDFPNLCDLYTLIIHPVYEELAAALGFQKTGTDSQLSVYWMYLAIDRFLALNIEATIPKSPTSMTFNHTKINTH